MRAREITEGWKKWAGAAAGLALGDLPGAVAGFTAGDYADKQERNAERQSASAERSSNWQDPDWRDAEMKRRQQEKHKADRARIDSDPNFPFIKIYLDTAIDMVNNWKYNGHNMINVDDELKTTQQKKIALRLLSWFLEKVNDDELWLNMLKSKAIESGGIYKYLLQLDNDAIQHNSEMLKNVINQIKVFNSEMTKIKYNQRSFLHSV
jgi:hypothetical protein